jgi:hypothetical protein
MNDDHFYFDEKEEKFYIEKNGQSYEDFVKKIKNPIQDEWGLEKLDGNFVTISKNCKEIKFKKEGEKTKNIFVVNIHQVNYLIDKFKYKHYKIDGKLYLERNINDSLNFNEIENLPNLLFKEDYEKAIENISLKSKVLLDDLSLMYFNYQKFDDHRSEFILSDERKELFKKLTNLINIKRFIPLCGPKSIGKTTSLLYYLKMKAPGKYFYINLSYCKKLLNDGKKELLCLCICKELFNCMKFEDIIPLYTDLYETFFNNIMDIFR